MEIINQVKAIVMDLDGTLLNNKKEVSERSKGAILSAYEKGITIIFATARPPRSVDIFLTKELQEISSIIYYNGAFIVDNLSGTRKHFPIQQTIMIEIVYYLLSTQPETNISIESEDNWYSYKALNYIQTLRVLANPIVLPLEEFKKVNSSKILISHCNEYKSIIDQFGDKVNIIQTDSGSLIQIMDKNVSKENAVMDLCMQKGIEMDYVMSFGDDWNDFNLFKESGFSVAMGNAIPELKQVASFVTKSNDEEGVAIVIEEVVSQSG
ncbi:Cof subfamily protein (haloacid dehalogenase superfamily) [Metabacillus crassostreae]|uniref:Cof-type HAD-IIB family hydrolase n=1 Tax=Metabacillus crassostreae TaxID=929098 RepID=UPI00195DA158|nr:Cof-type HAD-IIB family hydrolase [Metabacillus crassostreae]MBM7602477.1 Cof subfamily protein (haloacid dehalogenase superfamily) [Metabacillus crassostreae]